MRDIQTVRMIDKVLLDNHLLVVVLCKVNRDFSSIERMLCHVNDWNERIREHGDHWYREAAEEI